MTAVGAFGLGTFDAGRGAFPGIVIGDSVFDARSVMGADTTVLGILQTWDDSLARLEALLPELSSGVPLAELRPLPPVLPVGQIFCAGANYYRHVEQIVFSTLRNAGDTRADDSLREFAAEQARSRRGEPFMFTGIASAVSGARDDVVLWGPGVQHDWELELGVVIGRAADRVSPESAMDHVAGYTMSNDISVRDVMSRPGFPMTDFLSSKNRPSFFPTGPMVVPTKFVPDYRQLRITLKVNGEVMQDESVEDMIHGVEELVSYASQAAPLAPGDIILSGSPAGNAGHHGNRWLKPGDVMEASITGLGTQITRCVAPPT